MQYLLQYCMKLYDFLNIMKKKKKKKKYIYIYIYIHHALIVYFSSNMDKLFGPLTSKDYFFHERCGKFVGV